MSYIDIKLGAELSYNEKKLYEELKSKVKKAESTKQLLYDWADAHQDELLKRWMSSKIGTFDLPTINNNDKKDIVADLLLDELEAEYGDCDTDYFNEDDEDLFDVLDEYPLEEIDLLSLSPTIKESKPKHMPMPRCAEKIEEKPKYCKKIENGPRYSKVKKK